MTLKIVLYSAIGIAALVGLEIYRRSEQDVEPELLDIPEGVEGTIARLFDHIQHRREVEAIQWLPSNGNDQIFKLTQYPNLVFRAQIEASTRPNGAHNIYKCFENYKKVKKVQQKHHLDQLVIPKTALFKIDDDVNYPMIVEEEVQLLGPLEVQEELYEKEAARIEKPVQQLATLIRKTGLQNIRWQTIPLLHDHKIGIMYLYEMMEHRPEAGIRELAKCLFSKKSIQDVLQGTEPGIQTGLFGSLDRDAGLAQFHQKIKDPREPLTISLDDLGLDLETPYTLGGSYAVKLKDAAEATISAINEALRSQNQENRSVKSIRTIILNPYEDHSPLAGYQHYAAIDTVLQALQEKGQIFRFEFRNAHYYRVFA